MRLLEVVVTLTLCTLLCIAQDFDTSVCTPKTKTSDPTGPPLPKLSEITQFTTGIELNIVNKNKTIFIIEYYDFNDRRGAVYNTEGFDTIILIFNYYDNQMYTILPGEDICQVSDLSQNSQNFIFGYDAQNGGDMYSVAKALRFGDTYQLSYKGVEMVRGIWCDHWTSCVYMPEARATMNVDYYFSSTVWQTASTMDQIPVRIYIKGNAKDSDTSSHSFEHFYDFSHFYPGLTDGEEVFLTPKSMICPGKKNNMDLPSPQNHFSFTTEIVRPEDTFITIMREYYNYPGKLMRWDYTPSPYSPSSFGKDPLRVVHDFSTGVEYIIDRLLGNCTYRPIAPDSLDSKSTDDRNVRMRIAKEFFDFDNTVVQYTYEGKRTVRDITADVWVGKRINWPPGYINLTSKWEWYFSSDPWFDNSGLGYNFKVPLRLEITVPQMKKLHYIYNFYDYDEEQPSEDLYDIGSCYTFLNRRHFTFALPGALPNLVQKNTPAFKHYVREAVAENTGLSFIRINNMQLDYADKNVLVTFTMLDKAPITGSVQGKLEVDLTAAATSLNNTINAGQLVVTIPVNGQDIKLTAQPYSVKEVIREVVTGSPPIIQNTTNQGYTPGAMAAVGVSMIVVGGLLGVLGILLFNRFRTSGADSAFEPKRFVNTPDQQTVE